MTYLKPLPRIEPGHEPFWDGLKQREFRVLKCEDCGDFNWPAYPACRSCLSESQTWTTVSGDATVYSFSVVHRGPGAFDDEVPYGVVLAKLAEEPRGCLVLANSTGCDPKDLRVGMPLKIVFEDVPDEDVTLYKVTPVPAQEN